MEDTPLPPPTELSAAPVLSTPAEQTIFEDPTPETTTSEARQKKPRPGDDELFRVYEITRTVEHIRKNTWKRVALQFPDPMLPDAPWVVETITRELTRIEGEGQENGDSASKSNEVPRLYILADTSYSACCVDEIAAEHADADAVVHYGRSCLSPTARLPVLHIFTRQALDYATVTDSFAQEFPTTTAEERASLKAIIMADVMFQEHVEPICTMLQNELGYTSVIATDIMRDPAASIPNRRLVKQELNEDQLRDHHLFHIAAPPSALLLTLSSRLASLHIYHTPSSPYTADTRAGDLPDPSSAPALLRRRYGLVVRMSTASIIGILVNTLSVKNYMDTISRLREAIAATGKKSYTIVVGKLNAAKLANFAEVDGWVVVGCWESGLVDQDGMYQPVITPFEMTLALQRNDTRVWTGEWWGGIEGVNVKADTHANVTEDQEDQDTLSGVEGNYEGVDDEESAPPEFDLRTGKLVTNSRPMMEYAIRGAKKDATEPTNAETDTSGQSGKSSSALAPRSQPGEIASINGVASPGAEFLRSQRTWQGLGTDFVPADGEEYETSTVVEEGRSGVARGYTVGEDQGRT